MEIVTSPGLCWDALQSPLLPYDPGPDACIGRDCAYDDEVDPQGTVRITDAEVSILRSDSEQLSAGL